MPDRVGKTAGRTGHPVIVIVTCAEALSDNCREGGDSLVARVTFFLIVKIKAVKTRVCSNAHVT